MLLAYSARSRSRGIVERSHVGEYLLISALKSRLVAGHIGTNNVHVCCAA